MEEDFLVKKIILERGEKNCLGKFNASFLCWLKQLGNQKII